MPRSRTSRGFGVYVDPTKTTSGQRFFIQLGQALAPLCRPLEDRPAVVLFNISAPWREIVRAKWRGQKVVLRVDGLYADRLSPAFLQRFSPPLAALLGLGLRWPRLHDVLADLANLIDENYTAFLRIALSDWVIYQSRFSLEVHRRYFRNKPHTVIVNGSIPVPHAMQPPRAGGQEIRLVTIYDEWRPTKRIDDAARFVEWLVTVKGVKATLTILGYTGKVPPAAAPGMKALLERPFVRTLPRFTGLAGAAANALEEADCYLCFSFRDSCPNAVVESMAHGLPVLGVASGGLPDIVGDAGRLLAADDFETGHFSAHRFEHDFPVIDFEAAYTALQDLMARQAEYRTRVRQRFASDLDVAFAADRYAAVLRHLAGSAA